MAGRLLTHRRRDFYLTLSDTKAITDGYYRAGHLTGQIFLSGITIAFFLQRRYRRIDVSLRHHLNRLLVTATEGHFSQGCHFTGRIARDGKGGILLDIAFGADVHRCRSDAMISLALSRSILAADNRHITVSRELHAASVQSGTRFNGNTILLRRIAIGVIRGGIIAKSHCTGRLGTDFLSTGSVELYYLVSFLLLDDRG